MAGRSIPGTVRSTTFDIAISAPVLPAETTQCALPSATASIASRMLERLPERSACEGFASPLTASSVWCTVARRESFLCFASNGRILSSAPNRRKCTLGKRFSAICAPRTTISGAWSPPMASSAMTIPSATAVGTPRLQSSGVLRRNRHHFAAVVMSARRAHVMGALHLAAVRAFNIGRGFEGVMRAAHVAARFRGLFLRNGHGGNSRLWGATEGRCLLAKINWNGNLLHH